ncbi:hypothetical protein L6452_33805 [Arctium lappa]|uniref:Uncharacterized protein n=1 Tax=Arctium lappa TaxID=4217 RepID=A0ACB8YHL5_ARCLA|nr:hypothetical protein L6452_33805 [Arctium lappa]
MIRKGETGAIETLESNTNTSTPTQRVGFLAISCVKALLTAMVKIKCLCFTFWVCVTYEGLSIFPTSAKNRNGGTAREQRVVNFTGAGCIGEVSESIGIGRIPLNWTTRVQILKDVAKGLILLNQFLTSQKVAHADWSMDIFDLEVLTNKDGHEDMLKLAELALECTDITPDKRSKMTQILIRLEEIHHPQLNIEEKRGLTVKVSGTRCYMIRYQLVFSAGLVSLGHCSVIRTQTHQPTQKQHEKWLSRAGQVMLYNNNLYGFKSHYLPS